MAWLNWRYLREYCANCTIAGLSYISNQRLHFTERVFWLVCLAVSTFGSYTLINEFYKGFESKAVSIVYESVQPLDKIHFPTISICDANHNKETSTKIEEYIDPLHEEYQFSLENFLIPLVYPMEYIQNSFGGRCRPLADCQDDCVPCPVEDFRRISSQLRFNCSEMFVECRFFGEVFDCCRYFLPLLTPSGRCYFMNSYLNNGIGSPRWMNRPFGRADKGERQMTLIIKRPFFVNVLNPEDLPMKALPFISRVVKDRSAHKALHIYLENTVNDPDVRSIEPAFRKCRFPDELLPDTAYKAYSFSTCLADCIRLMQYQICNCSIYTLIPYPMDKYPDCDLEGYYCLEANDAVDLDVQNYLPWNTNKDQQCDCFPSCSESLLMSYHESALPKIKVPGEKAARAITVAVPFLPSERYRRQSLRSRLDILVTVGGIMGLFIGASVISGLEIFYYFTVRFYNSFIRRVA